MSDAALFVLVFGGLFILRGIAATIVFLWILPDGIRCPQCDEETTRVEPGFVMRWLPSFRSSWCLRCGWHGVHRIARVVPPRGVRGGTTTPLASRRTGAD